MTKTTTGDKGGTLSWMRSRAEERAEALWKRMKPKVLETIVKHSPERADLKFDEIESNSASVGDLIARMLMQEALKEQASTTAEEIQSSRESLADAARAVGKTPDQLCLTRIPKKPCEIGTLRGPLPHQREYLYFPELKQGIFPPR